MAGNRTQRPDLLMVVNEDAFFLSHRKEVALAASEAGWNVTLLARDTGRRRDVERLGIRFVDLPVNPTGTNVLQEVRTFNFLLNFYLRHRDAVVHHVGIKNIVWGGAAARIAHVRGVVDAVCGLGTLFSDHASEQTRNAILRIMRYGFGLDNLRVIFQNHDDEEFFLSRGLIRPSRSRFIKGSGVDLSDYTPAETSGEFLTVTFTARMLREKGVADLLEAARLLRPRWEGRVRFLLCGPLSNHPDAIGGDQLRSACDGTYIQWLGQRDDVADILRRSDIMAFPSYYREGLPKSLIEACAAGLPIVTCDSVGCRDAVREGVNGFKIPPRSPEILAHRLEILFSDPDLRARMGRASRSLAESDFDVRNVVASHLAIYRDFYK